MSDLQVRPDVIEAVVAQGDLSKLSNEQRVMYYLKVCDSLGLNPATRPFEYIVLNGRMVLYARKEASDQLRQSRGISITSIERERMEDVYIVKAKATAPDGRLDESIGVVNIGGLKGDALANALMKAETKAKRRVTLSICGLGFTDETEIETIPGARQVTVDSTTGEIQPQIAAPKQDEQPVVADKGLSQGFMISWKGKGLTEDEIHLNLNVTHLADYKGTTGDAAKILQAVVDKKVAAKKA